MDIDHSHATNGSTPFFELAESIFVRAELLDGVSHAVEEGAPSPVAALFARIDELAELTDDWDGDGAVAPNATAVANARRAALLLEGSALATAEVEPDVLGGLSIVTHRPDPNGGRDLRRAYIECGNDGSVRGVLDCRDVTRWVQARTLVDFAQLASFAGSMDAFLTDGPPP